ncbi:hypothetical protein [Halothiobacillus sp.]|uniref:hypothetical protein n=1 Tax=Halothiobacillus sp. TaxID=1891311 RepID=UPI002601C1B1|nr:hypothetical protein [Halothiobacillus sp.]
MKRTMIIVNHNLERNSTAAAIGKAWVNAIDINQTGFWKPRKTPSLGLFEDLRRGKPASLQEATMKCLAFPEGLGTWM